MRRFPLDHALILAGGGGTRLWPWTGPRRPKPLLPLGGGGRTLLTATCERVLGLVPPGRVALQAPAALAELLRGAEPRLSVEGGGTEPSPRDTGPAVALGMRRMLDLDPRGVVAVIPADQRVMDQDAFSTAMAAAAEAARQGWLVVLGIVPDHPATRFGYIETGTPLPGLDAALEVRRFVEKPDARRAEEFCKAGGLWNAGMFLWRADAFWEALEQVHPALADAVSRFVTTGNPQAWEEAPKLSIDYALMEKAPRVAAVPLAAGWDDVGGWEAVIRLAEQGDAGPARFGELKGTAAPGSRILVVGEGEVPAGIVLGAEPRLVIIGPEGILVAPPGETDAVKAFLG